MQRGNYITDEKSDQDEIKHLRFEEMFGQYRYEQRQQQPKQQGKQQRYRKIEKYKKEHQHRSINWGLSTSFENGKFCVL